MTITMKINLLIACLSCGLIFSQEYITGSIQYKEKDKIFPIEGANIFWLDSKVGTFTSKEGFFELEKIPNKNLLLISHLGRPTEGKFEEKFSLKPVADYLSKIINKPCKLISHLESEEIFDGKTDIQLLENIRFFKGEKENCQDLGKKLAGLGDIYVFDAFGTAHREQASTHSAIKSASKACAGLLLERETEFLSKALNNYDHPYIAVIGGAKVSTKLELIKHINLVADQIIVGGGIANTFLKASGLKIGKSLVEDSMLDIAKDLLVQGKIVLPNVIITSKTFEGEDIRQTSVKDVKDEEMILDLHLSD